MRRTEQQSAHVHICARLRSFVYRGDRLMRSETGMAVDFGELLEAFEFVSFAGSGENAAYLCKETGKIYWHSDLADDVEELPDDVEDNQRYIPIPDKRELDLGKPL